MTLGTAPWFALAVYVGWLARDVYAVWLDAQHKIEQARRDFPQGRDS